MVFLTQMENKHVKQQKQIFAAILEMPGTLFVFFFKTVNETRFSFNKDSKMKLEGHQPARKFIVDFLVILFGISSWVSVNGLWVELPIMVEQLPEKWHLSSYIVVTSQLANLGPILFSVARRIWSQKVLEVPVTHLSFSIGVTACFLLAGFWDRTSAIGSNMHSTALLSLAFFLAFVDCTSSVLYLPFMSNFRDIYIISFMVGEGMSGVLPSLVALSQGVGGNPECRNNSYTNVTESGNVTEYRLEPYYSSPRFSANIFFLILGGILILSWIAFILLRILPQAKDEMVRPMPVTHAPNPAVAESFMISHTPETSCSSEATKSIDRFLDKKSINKLRFYTLLAVQTYVCTLHNGVLLSIQTYSCLPYGNLAYHLAVSISSLANPAFCFLAMFLTVTKLTSVILITVSACVWAGYILTTAILSPTPPLVEHLSGAFLVVLSWIAFVGTVAFVKARIAAILRKEGNNESLFWCGVVTQVGSAIGAVVTFVLVNVANIFQSYEPCSSQQ